MTARPRRSPRGAQGRSQIIVAAAVALGLLVAAPSAMAEPPSNDLSSSPYNAAVNSFPVTVGANRQAEATTESNEPLTRGGLGYCNGVEMVATTWYRILGNGGTISVDTNGSTFDTVIAAYLAPTPTSTNLLGCNDDISAGDYLSAISFPSVAGTAYLIQVGACSGSNCGTATGGLQLNITATEPPPPPPPDTDQDGVPENGQDKCPGSRPTLDADRDGCQDPPPPPPPDTDQDGVPENGQDKCPGSKPTLDIDHNGCQDPPPPPKPILSDLTVLTVPLGRGRGVKIVSRASTLTVVPANARVSVSCSRCRKPGGFRSFKFTAKRSGKQVIKRLFGVELRRGGKLTVLVTRAGRLGRKNVVSADSRRATTKVSCLGVGSRTRRVPCPTA